MLSNMKANVIFPVCGLQEEGEREPLCSTFSTTTTTTALLSPSCPPSTLSVSVQPQHVFKCLDIDFVKHPEKGGQSGS